MSVAKAEQGCSTAKGASFSLFVKLVLFVSFAVAVLFASDVIEFQQTVGVSSSTGASAGITPFVDGKVQQKLPHIENENAQKEIEKDKAIKETDPPKTTPSPTDVPKNPPPTPYPTEKPANQPSDAPETPSPANKLDVPNDAKKSEGDNSTEEKDDQSTTQAEPATAVIHTPTLGAGNPTRHTYKRRGQPMDEEARKAMVDKWGSWTLVDNKERPKDDYYAAFPNRDVPRDKFPANAWQTDTEYLAKFVPEGLKIVTRAYNAILEEYGLTEDDLKFFHVEKLDNPSDFSKPSECLSLGGCTTKRSWENLKRRLLHAIMTEDSFVFAMGGHSSSAGHGNHFTQSYTLQIQWILEAVFARLGVRMQSRNFGLGGLGTIQSGLATKAIFGYDVDFLAWDSGMTEKGGPGRDLFFRQGMLGPGKVPVIMSLKRFDVIQDLSNLVDADFIAAGDMDNTERGIPKGSSQEEIDKMPWAIQYVRCESSMNEVCRANEYAGKCWIERDDVTPPTPQKPEPGGRANWHPGNRKHQSHGRNFAMMILGALKEVFTTWNKANNFEIPDKDWHVTSLYDNIRTKIDALPDNKSCNLLKKDHGFSDVMCKMGLKARTEFTPRANPDQSSIRSLMPPTQRSEINDPPPTIYTGPDVFNPNLHPPPGAIDVLNIVESGVDFVPNLVPDYVQYLNMPKFVKAPSVPVGKGHYLDTHAGFCDGSVDSWCRRDPGSDCLMYGHNDGRNGLVMNSAAGWMVLNLPDVKAGFIALKFETWHDPEENKRLTMNDQRRMLSKSHNDTNTKFLRAGHQMPSEILTTAVVIVDQERRQLKKSPPEWCDDFKFEFLVDGKKTTWNKDQFLEQNKNLQRVVEAVKLVEDPNLTGGKEKEIEVAFRMVGCEKKTFKLTHVYWA